MSVTIVNEPDGDVIEGKVAAAEPVDYFRANFPGVQVSLWFENALGLTRPPG